MSSEIAKHTREHALRPDPDSPINHENPPPGRLAEADAIERNIAETRKIRLLAYGFALLFAVIALAGAPYYFWIMAAAASAANIWIGGAVPAKIKEAEDLRKTVPLAFRTETFHAELLGGRKVSMEIAFELPPNCDERAKRMTAALSTGLLVSLCNLAECPDKGFVYHLVLRILGTRWNEIGFDVFRCHVLKCQADPIPAAPNGPNGDQPGVYY